MINVYFTASTSYIDGNSRTYQQIINIIEKNKAIITSGKQIANPSLLIKDKSLKKAQIFRREINLIDKSDCLIAEVTKPSLGVGGEIVYALSKNKPVLALMLENNEDLLSPMIAGNPSENLFIEYYNIDKLSFLMKDFLNHIYSIKRRKGYLIVLDGGDGSGKTTQAELLVDFLKNKKYPTKFFHFPQYYNSFHGKIVARFLRGEFGNIDQVSPYLISLAYALDRTTTKNEIDEFLKKGGYIVADRYASSSMAHQSAKFNNHDNKEEFLKWIYALEYKVNKMPKENIVIYLHVPWKIGFYLTQKKPPRRYLQGENADIHEKDFKYRQAVEKTYLELTKRYKHWVKIDCVSADKLLSTEIIHRKIKDVLKKKKLI